MTIPAQDPLGQTVDGGKAINLDELDTNGMHLEGDANEAQEGLTPMHRQNIDEARVDEVLVEDALDDKNYPNIADIADPDAVEHSHENDL